MDRNPAGPVADEPLERAVAALDAGTLEVALRELLEAWRACRHERCAALVEKVSARITATRARPGGKRVADKQAAWVELAGRDDPADLGVLLATVSDVAKADALSERLGLLAKRPADPRIAAALARWVEVPPIPGQTGVLPMSLALTIVVRTADPRQVPELERMIATNERGTGATGATRRYVRDFARRYVTQLVEATTVHEVSSALLDRVDALLVETSASNVMRGGVEELFAAVYARPDDDEPRAILADLLQERGDPRGELIALQLARAAGGPRSKREGELLRASGRDWLGAIEPLVLKGQLAFERGFVSRCAIKADSTLFHLAERPEWATVVDVDIGAIQRDVYGRYRSFLRAMPALRVLRGATAAGVPDRHPTLEEIELVTVGRDSAPLLARIADGLPALRRLTIEKCFEIAELEPLWASPLGMQLTFFKTEVNRFETWIPRMLALPIPEIVISDGQWGLRITGTTAQIEYVGLPSWTNFDELAELIAMLPSGRIRDVIIDNKVTLPDSITRLLDRWK